MDAFIGTIWWSCICLVAGWLVASFGFGFNEIKSWITKK